MAAAIALVGGGLLARQGCAASETDAGADAGVVVDLDSVELPTPSHHWSFDEGSFGAGQVRDHRGAAHAIMHGGEFVDGVVGTALSLDGVDDYLEVSPAPPLGDRFSIVAWVYQRRLPIHPDNPSIYDLWDWPNDRRAYALGTGGPYFAARVSPDGDWERMAEARTSTALDNSSLDRWTHVAMTYDGRSVRLYVDGRLKGTRSFDKVTSLFEPTPGYAAFIGRSHRPGLQYPGSFLDGVIDELAL